MTDEDKIGAALEHLDRARLTRALAILTTEVEDTDVIFQGCNVIIRGQLFDPRYPEDQAILAVLMANKEFGFAVSAIEVTAAELRALQREWLKAADKLGFTAVLGAEIAAKQAAAAKW